MAISLKEYGRETVHSVQVEFSTASASSLDYTLLADFDGSLAHRYKALQRKIQAICVDTCNANGWVIPFPQLTLHRAENQASELRESVTAGV